MAGKVHWRTENGERTPLRGDGEAKPPSFQASKLPLNERLKGVSEP